jgi:hypothetical protein
MTAAVVYMRNQREYLERYLDLLMPWNTAAHCKD